MLATTAELPVAAERRLTVDGTAPPSATVARVASWLDFG
jgi:hypothetical protein